jgi:hypothetical protein
MCILFHRFWICDIEGVRTKAACLKDNGRLYCFYPTFLFWKKKKKGLWGRRAVCHTLYPPVSVRLSVYPPFCSQFFVRRLMRSPCCLSVYSPVSFHLSLYHPTIITVQNILSSRLLCNELLQNAKKSYAHVSLFFAQGEQYESVRCLLAWFFSETTRWILIKFDIGGLQLAYKLFANLISVPSGLT